MQDSKAASVEAVVLVVPLHLTLHQLWSCWKSLPSFSAGCQTAEYIILRVPNASDVMQIFMMA